MVVWLPSPSRFNLHNQPKSIFTLSLPFHTTPATGCLYPKVNGSLNHCILEAVLRMNVLFYKVKASKQCERLRKIRQVYKTDMSLAEGKKMELSGLSTQVRNRRLFL